MMTQTEYDTLRTAVERMGRNLSDIDIDWEQRRYEMVKDFLAAMLSGSGIPWGEHTRGYQIEKTVAMVDEAIKELKGDGKA